ncbi:SNF5-domain-containing protein [Mycena amicta]|nr:SNF5-domain-containing protein [Mycena amicta]
MNGAYPPFQQSINPAMLASFNSPQQPQSGPFGGVSPAQLLNGMNPVPQQHSQQIPQQAWTLLANNGYPRETLVNMAPQERSNLVRNAMMVLARQQQQQQQQQHHEFDANMQNGFKQPVPPQFGPGFAQQPPFSPASPFNRPPDSPQVLRSNSMGPPPPVMRSSSAASDPSNGARPPSFGPQTPQRQPSIPRSVSPVKREQTTPMPMAPAPPSAVPLPQPGPSIPRVRPGDRVTVVPLATSMTTIPPLSSDEISQVKEWMQADQAYESLFRESRTHMGAELRDAVARSVAWWDRGSPASNNSRFLTGREKFEMRWPYRKKERDGRRKNKREGIKLPSKLRPEDANRPEELVPIRLEFDVDHQKVRDTFMWDMNACIISPEEFAQSMVEDYSLPIMYHNIIVKSIQEQLADYRLHSSKYDGDTWEIVQKEKDTLRAGKLDDESAAFWESWRNRLRNDFVAARAERTKGRKRRKILEDDGIEPPKAVDEFPLNAKTMREDTRIVIRLDITVGSIKLDDQFEWDLDNEDASPEAFAEVHAQELGLGGEFKTAIAHSIREQLHAYQKSIFLVGPHDEDLRNSFLPTLSTGARAIDQVQAFTPLLNYLSDGELERNEKERDKDFNKRRKRGRGGRRGVLLPDRDPIRTCRTPAIGFPEPDPATVAAAAVNAPVSRRAAAAAASVTIANLVASENGGPAFTPSVMPSLPAPAPLVFKEKSVKGFFKPPPYSRAILRPRARATAPVPSSTAVDVSTLPAPLENDPPPRPTAAPRIVSERSSRPVTAKQKKEAEREAKEKEFAEGQRPNMVNGVWHCSNCGCPESIAVGRRKGPLGDKSQCGTCGKYWHRYRKPRPIEYNSSYEFHANGQKKEAEMARRRKGRPPNSTVPATPVDTSEPQTPRDEGPSRQSLTRDESPVSTTSSASEVPLAQRVKSGGPTSSPAVQRNGAEPPVSQASLSSAPPPKPAPDPASLPPKPTQPPDWLLNCMQDMQNEWKNDKFEVICKANTTDWEWRIKCLDCPGKVYITGPDQTLSNYELHLKNRLHRQRVNERMRNSSVS